MNSRSLFITLVMMGYLYLGSAQVFTEVSSSIGVDQLHTNIFLMGGGVAVLDYDNDGWEDIYMTGGEAADKLFRNLGDGSFQNTSSSADLPLINSSGVVAGDLNNDGYQDLVITSFIYHSDLVLQNNGDGTFTAIQALGPTMDWSTSASLADVNKDGLLDIYMVCYVEQSSYLTDSVGTVIGFSHDCFENRLYINQGNFQFLESASDYGLNDNGCALAVAFTDFDNDTDSDIFLANDFGAWVVPDRLFRNEFPLEDFIEVGGAMNADAGIYGMGVAIGDYDHDHDLDYYVSNMGDNRLHRNDQVAFSDQAEFANVENDSMGGAMNTSWGAMFMDYDNDMFEDLFVANGEITTGLLLSVVDDDPDRLFVNNGDGTFTDETFALGLGETTRSRGCAKFDYDNDGDMDIVVATVDIDSTEMIRNLVYRNDQNTDNHYLKVKPIGVISNQDAIGTHARIVVNGESWITEVDGGSSHGSSSEKTLHFGLGSNTIVDSLILTFPSGIVQTLVQVQADQTIEVLEDIAIGIGPKNSSFSPFISYDDQGNVFYNGTGGSSLRIIDARGRVLHQRKVSFSHTMQKVNLGNNSNLATGVYYLRVDAEEGTKTLKFLVQ